VQLVDLWNLSYERITRRALGQKTKKIRDGHISDLGTKSRDIKEQRAESKEHFAARILRISTLYK
jgi:hypothetical protein